MPFASPQMPARSPGRFHAFLVGAMVPLFLGAWLSDYAYWSSHQIEWSNFASWLLAGGLVIGGAALLCIVVGIVRAKGSGAFLIQGVVLLATWVLGFIDALVHARDAWAVMPTGLVLSLVVTVLACASAWIAFSPLRAGAAP